MKLDMPSIYQKKEENFSASAGSVVKTRQTELKRIKIIKAELIVFERVEFFFATIG